MNEREKEIMKIERLKAVCQDVLDGIQREGDVGRVRYTVPRRLVDRLTIALAKVQK